MPVDAYLARQPIFNGDCQVQAYELLYRDAQSLTKADFADGDRATQCLLSDAITLFGLPNLTNSKPAFVNFTENLILNDYIYLAKPDEIVVELVEDIPVTDRLIQKLGQVKERGYTLALDDYDSGPRFEKLLPLVDILKVDMRLTTPEQQARIVQSCRGKGPRLLAEKVETGEEFEYVKKLGYHLFQGYFFERPVTMRKELPNIALSSYTRILSMLQSDDVDFAKCARIIHADVVLTYCLMRRIQTTQYYRRNPINSIERALVMMGTAELRRWILLIMARNNNVAIGNDELVREAYLRGCFAKRLLQACCPERDSEDGFLLGMFSMLDKILGTDMGYITGEVTLPAEVEAALLGAQDNAYARLLQFILFYEMRSDQPAAIDIGRPVPAEKITELYMKSVAETDYAFMAAP